MRYFLLSLVCLAPTPGPPEVPTKELFIGSWEKSFHNRITSNYTCGKIVYKEDGTFSYKFDDQLNTFHGKWYISSRNELVMIEQHIASKPTWTYKISFEKWPTISCYSEYDWPKTPEMLLWRE